MDATRWQQVTIAYPGTSRWDREQQAVAHLRQILPEAETAGLITAWWYIRKGPWRIRYLPADPCGAEPIRRSLTNGMPATNDIYEPETHAFGGPAAMDIAHTLFHQDSRAMLDYLCHQPAGRREQSLILSTALMRAAGLDLEEQGDVWAQIAELRALLLSRPTDPEVWAAFTSDVRYLLLGAPNSIDEWRTSFTAAGANMRTLRETGQLTRGIRAVIAKHVIFHWNRIGISAATQATLARAARDAIFGSDSLNAIPT